jgi:hypothetical protein
MRIRHLVLLSSALCAVGAGAAVAASSWGCSPQTDGSWACGPGIAAPLPAEADLAAARAASVEASERTLAARLAALDAAIEARRRALAAEEARAVVVAERLLSLRLEAERHLEGVESRAAEAVARRRSAEADVALLADARAEMAALSDRLPRLRADVDAVQARLSALQVGEEEALRAMAERRARLADEISALEGRGRKARAAASEAERRLEDMRAGLVAAVARLSEMDAAARAAEERRAVALAAGVAAESRRAALPLRRPVPTGAPVSPGTTARVSARSAACVADPSGDACSGTPRRSPAGRLRIQASLMSRARLISRPCAVRRGIARREPHRGRGYGDAVRSGAGASVRPSGAGISGAGADACGG